MNTQADATILTTSAAIPNHGLFIDGGEVPAGFERQRLEQLHENKSEEN